MDAEAITIPIQGDETVSGLWLAPPQPRACLALAHGAGAGMTHKSMAAIADGLADRGVASLRYQFPYMERGGKRVDQPPVAHATVRKAVAAARLRAGPMPCLPAGGRSVAA
jgi:predicted alpha/beta-hydrolase family hydrolase